ncbi:MAG: NtaA/DmoA family FMN-dependent monooxygenase [Sphingobium sp.]
MPKQMHLGKIITGTGGHIVGWRMPQAEFGAQNVELTKRLTQLAEKAKFDFIFIADAVNSAPDMHPSYIVTYEPMSVLSALTTATSRIGLVGTISTTFSEPYNVARALSTLDHMSQGRAGWNVVTSVANDAAKNFSQEAIPDTATRYAMAAEHLEVCKGLWDSWEDGALEGNKETGVYVNLNKRHELNHKGTYHQVQGPLNITRMPQGYPVIFQAGASDRGIAFAAASADAVFSAQHTQESAIAYNKKLRDTAEAAGRPRDSIKILCGVCAIVGKDRQDALAQIDEIGSRLDDDPVHMGALSERLGHDMTQFPLDEPVPDLEFNANTSVGHATQLIALAKRENMTLRQLRDFTAMSAGHRVVFGSPEEIADDLQSWVDNGACDGFVLMTAWEPKPFEDFCEKVIPILVERGAFRADYDADTLRGHLGLSRPAHPAA